MKIVKAKPIRNQFEDGNAAYERRDHKTAMRLLKPFAEQGDSSAQAKVGSMYVSSFDIKSNSVSALKWLGLSAAQGCAEGQYELGYMYYRGTKSTPQNFVEAVKWFRLAADQGDEGSQDRLGDIYLYGKEGVPKDYVEAAKWYRLVAEKGDPLSQNQLAVCTGKVKVSHRTI